MQPVPVLQAITRLIVGGAQETVMYTAALLDRSRYRVEVLSGPQTGSEGSLIEEIRGRGIPLTILPSLVREIHLWKDLVCLVRLVRFLRRRRFVIVHTNSSKAGILGRLAARWAGVPVIVHTVHGWSFHDRMSLPVRKMYIYLERMVAPMTDAFIVVTDRDIEKSVREGIGRQDQYHLIRSAIPVEEFDPAAIDRGEVRRELGIPEDVPVLGNIGRFSPQKNPLDWVRVASQVAREIPRAWFLLVGDGPLRAEVESLLRQEGIFERTVLTGLRRDVPRMLSAMDVLLMTSLWEGLPRVIPQSLAMRIPVVANRVDGSAEAIEPGKTGFLVEPGDVKTAADCCLLLLRDEARRREMGLLGRERASSEFDVAKMVNDTAALYDSLLRRKGLSP